MHTQNLQKIEMHIIKSFIICISKGFFPTNINLSFNSLFSEAMLGPSCAFIASHTMFCNVCVVGMSEVLNIISSF